MKQIYLKILRELIDYSPESKLSIPENIGGEQLIYLTEPKTILKNKITVPGFYLNEPFCDIHLKVTLWLEQLYIIKNSYETLNQALRYLSDREIEQLENSLLYNYEQTHDSYSRFNNSFLILKKLRSQVKRYKNNNEILTVINQFDQFIKFNRWLFVNPDLIHYSFDNYPDANKSNQYFMIRYSSYDVYGLDSDEYSEDNKELIQYELFCDLESEIGPSGIVALGLDLYNQKNEHIPYFDVFTIDRVDDKNNNHYELKFIYPHLKSYTFKSLEEVLGRVVIYAQVKQLKIKTSDEEKILDQSHLNLIYY